MVECEFLLHFLLCQLIAVLIDTWWNVNMEWSSVTGAVTNVLIDTWWNVNTESICKWFGIQPF